MKEMCGNLVLKFSTNNSTELSDFEVHLQNCLDGSSPIEQKKQLYLNSSIIEEREQERKKKLTLPVH